MAYIDKNKSLPPVSEMENLLLLAATLYIRTPYFRDLIETPIKRFKEVVDDISNNVRISNKSDFDNTNTDLVRTEIGLIDTVLKCLSNKYYRMHIVTEHAFYVVTSDNPLILTHPNGENKGFYFGINTPNIEICLPINRKAALIGRNESFKGGVVTKIIGLANFKIILNAERFCYSSKPEITLVDDDLNVHRYDINANKIEDKNNQY